MPSRALWLVVLCLGCNDHRYGFFGAEDGETTGSTDPTDEEEPQPPDSVTVTQPVPPDPDPAEPTPVCAGERLPSEAPLRVVRDNNSGQNCVRPSCGDDFAVDAVFTWTAPFDGSFRFDTAGSGFDTVLAVFENLEGSERGCNDDALGVFSSVTEVVAAGTTVTIVVEGKSGQTGPLTVNIHEEPTACIFDDIGAQLGGVVRSTELATNTWTGACGGGDAKEVVFGWLPPFAGSFRFETVGSQFDAVVYARQGDCSGAELRCAAATGGQEASLELFLTPEGGPLRIFVDGLDPSSSGEIGLRVSRI